MKEILIPIITGMLALFTEILLVRKATYWVVLSGLLLTFAAAIYDLNVGQYDKLYGDFVMLEMTQTALGFIAVLSLLTASWFVLAHRYFTEEAKSVDYQALVIFSFVGAICMVSFTNLIMFFLGLEILSIPMYVLAGSRKLNLRSNEAAFKYFLMGAFASALTLMGIALLYGATGSFDLYVIADRVSNSALELHSLAGYGALFLIGGMSFKIAAAPFHFWAPDVYQGAPTPVTALMAVMVKTAAIVSMLLVFQGALGRIAGSWTNILAVIAAVSILLGNLIALWQESVKRLLAYSSIAHAGYLLIAVLVGTGYASQGLTLYTLSYGAATLLAFFVLYFLTRNNGNNTEVSALEGLGKSHPMLAGIMTVAFLSLAGIPPTSGFMAKYLLFAAGLQTGYIWLIVIAVIGSLISLFYYLKVISAMYFGEPSSIQRPELTWSEEAVLLFLAGLTLLLGILPSIVL
jgi:NADH-quinone oxidoreductase subunit N